MTRGRPVKDKSGAAVRRSVKLRPCEVEHLVTIYGNLNRGVNVLIRIDRTITAGQRRALIHRYGTVSRGLLECVRNEVGPGREDHDA